MPAATNPPISTPEQRLREFWAHFDAKDYQSVGAVMADDAMETDDFAKVWVRGRAAIAENFARIGHHYTDSRTSVSDVNVTEVARTAVVTCVVHYDMRWKGEAFSSAAPTTVVFVRDSGEWRIALLHTR